MGFLREHKKENTGIVPVKPGPSLVTRKCHSWMECDLTGDDDSGAGKEMSLFFKHTAGVCGEKMLFI
jgi:hypothetical protein